MGLEDKFVKKRDDISIFCTYECRYNFAAVTLSIVPGIYEISNKWRLFIHRLKFVLVTYCGLAVGPGYIHLWTKQAGSLPLWDFRAYWRDRKFKKN